MKAEHFRLGPFKVDAAGRLFPGSEGMRPGFGFRWRGRPVEVRLDERSIDLRTSVGLLPSTADSPVCQLRAEALAVVRWISRQLMGGWRVRVRPDYSVHLETEISLAEPATAAVLIAEITQLILAVDPLLLLFDEYRPGARASVPLAN
jgi:hypothetical protein